MSRPEPSNEFNSNGSNLQRVAIGAATLLVVILTVVIAIFLTLEESVPPDETAVVIATQPPSTPIPATLVVPSTSTPLPQITNTPAPIPPTATFTPIPVEQPTDTPAPPSNTPEPAAPSTATFTPAPANPTTSPETNSPNGRCPLPGGWVTYVAQVGDTYETLANRTGILIRDLQAANCPDVLTIQPGDLIYLPRNPDGVAEQATSFPTAIPTTTAVPIIPTINRISPDSVAAIPENGLIITVIGGNFRTREAAFRAELRGADTIALTLRRTVLLTDNINIDSDTSFDAIVPHTFNNQPVQDGIYDLVVTNPNGRSAIAAKSFFIGVTPTPTSTPTSTSTPTATFTPTSTPTP